jgi:hypothetical protein
MSIIFGGLLALRLLAPGALDAQEAGAAKCCFQHVGYNGTCVVEPAEGETCESILTYLNTPGTVGKTYCGGSRLRGGWVAVDCDHPQRRGDAPSRPK